MQHLRSFPDERPQSSSSDSSCTGLPCLALTRCSSAPVSSGLRQLRSSLGSRLTPVSTSMRSCSSSCGFSPSSCRCGPSPSSCGLSSYTEEKWHMARSPWPSPPLYHSHKAEAFFRTTDVKHVISDSGLVTLPRSKAKAKRVHTRLSNDEGPADNEIGQAKPLPLEGCTAEILDEIFPVSPGGDCIDEDSYVGSCHHGDKSRTSTNIHSRMSTPGAHGRLVFSRHPDDYRTEHMVFRQMVLHKLSTLKGDWEIYIRRCGGVKKEVNHHDFMKFMDEHFRTMIRSEHEAVFDFLDADNSGTISALDYAVACEAVAPVKDIHELRCKLVSLGYSAMHQVLAEMEAATKRAWEPFSLSRRLDLDRFGKALWQVGIEKKEEHRSIFKALTKITRSSTVALDELRSALTALGPPMILEDLRYHMLTKFRNLAEAFDALDIDEDSEVSASEFAMICEETMNFPKYDASKAYRLIDLDDSNGISRAEFIAALLLAEPNLYLERARKRVRQRWRSIEAAMVWHQKGLETFDPEIMAREPPADEKDMDDDVRQVIVAQTHRPSISQCVKHQHLASVSDFMPIEFLAPEDVRKNQEQFQFIFSKASFDEFDTALLFKRIDVDGAGKLSSQEFGKGIRTFAPSCVLEELRLQCVEKYGGVSQAFESQGENLVKLLNLQTLTTLLEELGIARDVNVRVIVDLVERPGGGVLLSELVVALEAASLGAHVALPTKQRDAKAVTQVHQQMVPFRSKVEEHRGRVRQVVTKRMTIPTGFANDPGSYLYSSAAWQTNRPIHSSVPRITATSLHVLPTIGEPVGPTSSPPECEPRTKPPRWAVESKETTMKLLRSATPDPFRDLGTDYKEMVEDYFSNANKTLAADSSILRHEMVTPLKQFHKMKAAGLA